MCTCLAGPRYPWVPRQPPVPAHRAKCTQRFVFSALWARGVLVNRAADDTFILRAAGGVNLWLPLPPSRGKTKAWIPFTQAPTGHSAGGLQSGTGLETGLEWLRTSPKPSLAQRATTMERSWDKWNGGWGRVAFPRECWVQGLPDSLRYGGQPVDLPTWSLHFAFPTYEMGQQHNCAGNSGTERLHPFPQELLGLLGVVIFVGRI